MTFQYVTVKMPWSKDPVEGVWTTRLNQVAAEGWRLICINQQDFKGGASSYYATFEREVPSA
jgi:hypothetical protein